MKTFFSKISIAAGISLIAALPLAAQKTGPSAAATPKVGVDAKEKAEDAAMLQQLDIDQQTKAELKQNGQWAPGNKVSNSYHNQNLLGRAATSPRALVIRTTESDPKAQAALEEDLAVMSHILNKSLEEIPGGPGNAKKVMGIDVFFTASSALRSLYLDHYGAVFFLGVNFPLVAPQEKHQEEKPVGDSTWEEARQEIYGQRSPGAGEPAEDYSQEKVDRLKDALFAALKNAANIRGLRPDEFVTIWVSGGNSVGGRGRTRGIKTNPPGTLGGNIMALESQGQARCTVMTIQAKKSDIDAYAKGGETDQEFQKHARLTTYTGDAAGVPGDAVTFYSGRLRF